MMSIAEKAGVKLSNSIIQEGSKNKEEKVTKLEKAEKAFMNGYKAKMYKTDGSVS